MACQHCYHLFTGPIWMVLPNGHVVEQCCLCRATRTVHRDHRRELTGGRPRQRDHHGPSWTGKG